MLRPANMISWVKVKEVETIAHRKKEAYSKNPSHPMLVNQCHQAREQEKRGCRKDHLEPCVLQVFPNKTGNDLT
jgi:hypothetical protein